MATVREKKLFNLFHEIVSQSFFPFAVFTVEGKLIDCSDDFCKLTGYPREELYEVRMTSDLTAAKWKAEEQKQLQRLLHNKIPVHYKKEIITKEGRRVPVHVCCGCPLDSSGDIKYLYKIFILNEEDHDHKKLH
ncbi:MAG: PAS domain-containing protein, partial [Candidatus Aminicenantes bacterium]|nr:PAS domain-containing protein [Candidatus Aminicenantes bacterium]